MQADPMKARCELALIDYTEQAWHVLEPGTKFQRGRAVEAIAEHLQAVTEGQIRKLLINVPPGCTKSWMTCVAWPTWEWGPRGLAHHRFIGASYEQGLSIRDAVRSRDLVRSEWYQARWPLAFKDDQDQKTYYENTNTGWRFSSSVRASLTGYRGDRILIDDPHSVKGAESDAEREESLRWFAETLPTRLNKANESAIVVIMQRLHQRDIAGLILEELGEDWVHLCLPMEYEKDRHCATRVVMPKGNTFADWRTEDGELLWPERFPRNAVDELKTQLRAWGGSYAEAAQLQQRPAPREGNLFKVDKVQFLDAPPANVVRVCRGWDFAATSRKKNPRAAYSAGAKLGMTADGKVIILDCRRVQAGPGEVKTFVRSAADQDGRMVRISIPQDPGQAGVAQVADYAKDFHGFLLTSSPEAGEKAQRALPLAAQMENGNVYIVRGPWNDAYLAELRLFPNSDYKDQADATSRAYAELLNMAPAQGPRVPATLLMRD